MNAMATLETPNLDDGLLNQPQDILYNIFLRLPVKTLSILKSVCKSLLSVISSRDFIKYHLSISTNDPHFTRHRLILANDWTHEYPDDKLYFNLWTCSLYSLLREPFTHTLQYNDLDINNIVGYCNGLVVVEDDSNNAGQLFLWNPSTKKLRTLPKLNRISFRPATRYGFCYDELNEDFKVFSISPARLYNQIEKSRTHYEYKVSVYSLKCGSWRMIGDFPFRLAVDKCFRSPDFFDGNFANRSLYWIATPEIKKRIIVSLDIETETFQEVLQPNFGDGVYYWDLGTFDNSLFVLCRYENTGADLWIMKECGAETSWTKLFTIFYMDRLVTHHSYLKPVSISTNGDVMLIVNDTLVLYNPKEKTFKKLLPNKYFKDVKVYPYVESLVSPYL